MEDFVTVATYFSLPEAEAVRLALDAEGIQTLATDENLGEMLVPTAFGGIKLQVPAGDVARANEVLAALRRNPVADCQGRRLRRRRLPELSEVRCRHLVSLRTPGTRRNLSRVRSLCGRAGVAFRQYSFAPRALNSSALACMPAVRAVWSSKPCSAA